MTTTAHAPPRPSPPRHGVPGRPRRVGVGRRRRPGEDQPRPSGRGVGALILVGAGTGAVAVLAWWWATAAPVSDVGGWLSSGGRLTGLMAGYAMPLLLLSMARVPLAERHVGADRLTRWHARLGRWTLGLVVAHALLITWGYAAATRAGLLDQASTLLLSYPDVLMATVAAALLVGVGVASARAARSRLRYETWYYLHLYTYLAIALSFAHVFATGEQFAAHPFARWAWSALYVVAAAAVLWSRLVAPVRQSLAQRFRVERVVVEGAGVTSVVLRGRDVAAMDVRPGQFVRVRALTRDGWWSSHPYSLSAAPAGDRLRVTAKGLGDHSAGLADVRPGTRVLVLGPYGALTAERRSRTKVLLLAGGIGVTPLRALFQTLPAAPGDLTLVHRARTVEDMALRDELVEIARRRRQHLHLLPGPSGGAGDPLPGRRLLHVVPDVAEHDVYVCGPPGFTAAARAALHRCGVPRSRVHAEQFSL